MRQQDPRLIDMYPDGRFRPDGLASGRPPGVAALGASPLAGRLFRAAVVVAVVCGLLGAAFLAFWFALALIPLAFIAGLVAWATLRFQVWRARRLYGGSVRRF